MMALPRWLRNGVAFSVLLAVSGQVSADEPRGLGRLFRFGNRGNSSSVPEPPTRARTPERVETRANETSAGMPANRLPASGARATGTVNLPTTRDLPTLANTDAARRSMAPLATPPASSLPAEAMLPQDVGAPALRLVPQPRVSKPATSAAPILTRVQIGRSDDGGTFGMFLQIYADGTVIDSEGVHRVGADVMRPLIEALRAADVGRIKGHCGGPPVDYIQQVMLIVYDQNRGRLQANSFSYSGNLQGCDPAIKQLQDAIDAVQMRLSPAMGAASSASVGGLDRPPNVPMSGLPRVNPGDDLAPLPPVLSVPGDSGTVLDPPAIPLSPLE